MTKVLCYTGKGFNTHWMPFLKAMNPVVRNDGLLVVKYYQNFYPV